MENNTRVYEVLRSVKLRKANFEHFDGITKHVEKTKDLKSMKIDINTLYYTESKEIKDKTIINKLVNYINEVEDKWNQIKSFITYIVVTIILTVIKTIITVLFSRRRMERTEKRVNLIEGFLPEMMKES